MGDTDEGQDESSRRPEPAKEAPRPSQPPRPSQAPRPSQPPHAPDPWHGLSRLLFAGGWLVVQVVLVLLAQRSADGAFGFRMFPESSTIKVSLLRDVRVTDGERTRVVVLNGKWSARDTYGVERTFAWTDRVRRPELATFDVEIAASYGARAQLERLQRALDDVSAHIPEDVETERLLLEVTVRHNGREPYLARLEGPVRPRPGERSR